MRIERVELHYVVMPMARPFRTALGTEAAIHGIVVRMTTDAATGWSEVSALRGPFYASDWAAGIFELLREWMAPALLGREIVGPADLQVLLAPFRGNAFAKAALDVAWWDAYAKMRGEPLWRLLGGRGPAVTVGADIDLLDEVGDIVGSVAEARAAGYERVKLKIGRGRDLDVVRAVRRSFPDLMMHVDCNGTYGLGDLPLFRELDRYGLAMIEQPLGHDDLIDHATLQRELATPICLDESISSPDKARKAIEIGACRWINVKVGRVGGLTNAVAIHDLCRANGVPCWVGGMLESALGQAASLALATLPNFTYPADIFPSSRFYPTDLSEPVMELAGPARIEARRVPGLGHEPDPVRLARMTVRKAVLDTDHRGVSG